MSVQRAQFEISSSEFLEWIAYLDDKFRSASKQDRYLAAIAAEIRRSWVDSKYRKGIKEADFLLTYVNKVVEKKSDWKSRMKSSKKFWFALTGLKGKNNG